MRKPVLNLQDIKAEITKLKGKDVYMSVNRGRNRFIHYHAVIQDIYNSVFVVKLQNQEKEEKLSYSFCDVLCGDVKIAGKK